MVFDTDEDQGTCLPPRDSVTSGKEWVIVGGTSTVLSASRPGVPSLLSSHPLPLCCLWALTSVFFSTAVIVGGVVGALFAAFLVTLLIYRMKKKDEGSYTLEEPKQASVTYQKPDKQEEFYA